MRKVENQCVDCGLPCIGDSCPHANAVVYYCDNCGEYADYEIDGEDLCKECAERRLRDIFEDMPVSEQAEKLGVLFRYL